MAVINIKHLNRYLSVISHKPVDIAAIIATLAKRELNLLNDMGIEAEAYRLGIHTVFGTASTLIILTMLVKCYASDREARQRQEDKDQCAT